MKVFLNYKSYTPDLNTLIDESSYYVPPSWQLQQGQFLLSSLFYKKMLARLMLVDLINEIFSPFYGYNAGLEFEKPIYKGVSVSISYSADLIVVGVSSEGNIGVDVEKMNNVDFYPYETEYTSEEWRLVSDSVRKLEGFYTIWTRKEAVLKADGRGLSQELSTFSVTDDVVKLPFSVQLWNLCSFRLLEVYMMSVAGSEQPMEIKIEEAKIFNFEAKG